MYSILVDNSREHKKAKGVERNVVALIIHGEHKCFLMNMKCLRHSMNRTQSKDRRIRSYEISKIFIVLL